MIEIRNAGKVYGRRPGVVALRGVSLTIPAGRVTAVIGPNGAGKSTLFGLVLGFLRPSSGDVSINDAHPRDYMHDHGIGYVSERFALPPGWPVRRALAALGGLSGLSPDHVDTAIGEFGLTEHRDKMVGDLSRGLLQRVGLALAFGAHRDLVVLDEPAEGLDPVWRIRLRDRITEQRRAGRTVLLASHDLAEVERIADTVIVLDRGEVKDVLDAGSDKAAPTAYRISLSDAFPRFAEVFPNATANDTSSYDVVVDGVDDLNNRVAALIEAGGRILDVRPAHEGLEPRLRRMIEP